LTLLIAAFAASAFVRPDYLLTQDGPLGQAQQVAAEVAQQTVNSYDWGGKLASGPCDGMAGNRDQVPSAGGEGPVSAAEVARPIQDSITNALIVKPFMLLEYGRILDPAKTADRTAYAVHLKWITGGYKASAQNKGKDARNDACRRIRGEAKKYCERSTSDVPSGSGTLPALTPGGELLDASNAIVTDDDREFSSFLADMKRAGPVGKACAAYAEKPTWWRVCGAGLLLIAALFICGMLLSSAIVLLGTQGICAAAAAAGGVTFIAGMLPGPARQSVWRWVSLWGIAVLALVGICAFVPFFGIAVDATITNGPDLVVERILLIDVLAIAGAAGHRRLLTGITSFGRRMAMRMRYAKVGGTHLPGDTSELGAALAMNSPAHWAATAADCAPHRRWRPVRDARHPPAPDGRLRLTGRRRGHAGGHRGTVGRRDRRSRTRTRTADRGCGRRRARRPARWEGRALAAHRPTARHGQAHQVAQAHRRRRPTHWRTVRRRTGRGGPGGADRAVQAAAGRSGPAVRPTGTAMRTARSSTATRVRCCTTRPPTAPCCPPARTTGSSASAATASCTAAAAPPMERRSACPLPSALRGRAARATPRTPASKCRYGATPSARTFTPGETPDG
jgi:Uncharacterized conserved protein